jgi:hypothetical protein
LICIVCNMTTRNQSHLDRSVKIKQSISMLILIYRPLDPIVCNMTTHNQSHLDRSVKIKQSIFQCWFWNIDRLICIVCNMTTRNQSHLDRSVKIKQSIFQCWFWNIDCFDLIGQSNCGELRAVTLHDPNLCST